MGIIEIDFKWLEDKIANSLSSPTFGQRKNVTFKEWRCSRRGGAKMVILERESLTSL